jgi:hypothetical protein
MNEGVMGEFAKKKINHVVDLLQRKHSDIEANKKEIENTINLVGEPIIKSKLTQMLSERTSIDGINLRTRVQILEDEIKELKQTNRK